MTALFFNKRMLLHQNAKGIAQTTDICITPALVPLAFTNVAKTEDLAGCDSKFLINGYPVATFNSYIQKTTGDESGTLGGVISGTTAGKAVFVTHADGFTVNGVPVVLENDQVISNSNNSSAGPMVVQEKSILKDAQIVFDKILRPKTPYSYSIDVIGSPQLPLQSIVVLKDEKNTVEDLLSVKPQKISESVQRLNILNLPMQSFSLSLQTDVNDGSLIPLSYTAEKATTKIPAENEAPTLLMPVILALQNNPTQKTFSENLTDLFRVESFYRQKAYVELLQKSATELQKSSWTSLISSALENLLKASLETPSYFSEGFVTVFVNNYLWREVKLNNGHKGPYYENIDLSSRFDEDKRNPFAETSKRIELLMKTGGQNASVEIAYFPVQVNWARLQAFGGMLENDFRINKKKFIQGNSNGASFRSTRKFVTLDASPFLSKQKSSPAGKENPDILIYSPVVDNAFPIVLLDHPLIFIERAINDIAFVNAQQSSSAKTVVLHQLQQALSDMLYDKGLSKTPIAQGIGDLLCDYHYDLSKAYTLLKNCLSALYVNADKNNLSPFFKDLLSGSHPLFSSFFPTQSDMQKAASQYNTPEAIFKVRPENFRKFDTGSNQFFLENFIYCANEGWRAGRLRKAMSKFPYYFKYLKLDESLEKPMDNLFTLLGNE